jgi:translation initiation factor 3 subunit K
LPSQPRDSKTVRSASDLSRTAIFTEDRNSYQFNPDLYNPDVIINILLKALTQTQYADFNLCLALLDDRPPTAQLDEPDPLPLLLPHLISLHALLEQCRFPAFWTSYKSEEMNTLRENYTVEVAGFEDAVRDTVIRSVKATFTSIGATRLSSYLNLEGTCHHRTTGSAYLMMMV